MATKVATVIANETGQRLTLKVGNRDCFVILASVEDEGEYTMRLCMDWTYQEFVLESNSDPGKRVFVSSDDCCDYERMIVKECDGVFSVETVARREICEPEESDSPVDEHTTIAKKDSSCWRFWRQTKLIGDKIRYQL